MHKASYSEEDVALKKLNLTGMTAVERRKVLARFAAGLGEVGENTSGKVAAVAALGLGALAWAVECAGEAR